MWFLRKCADIPPGKTKKDKVAFYTWSMTFHHLNKRHKDMKNPSWTVSHQIHLASFLFPPVTASNYAAINCPLLCHIWIWCWQQVSSLSLYLMCFSQTYKTVIADIWLWLQVTELGSHCDGADWLYYKTSLKYNYEKSMFWGILR